MAAVKGRPTRGGGAGGFPPLTAQPAPNICQRCGKRKQSFNTRREAKALARLHHPRLRVYPCGTYFHLTSMPAVAVAAARRPQ